MKRIVFAVLVLIVFSASGQQNGFGLPLEKDSETNETVVGAIEGSVSVSALGGASYTIPIQLPDGIQGIQPDVSIIYNNQSGNGLLGWNWNLNAYSAITRTGTTIYHDGYMGCANFNDDRFLLDGQCLMLVDGIYGEHEASYRTEVDMMSRIVSYEENGIQGPSYFIVHTADGKIIEYGNSTHPKIELGEENHVCIWLINRVEDKDGNYMTYEYSESGIGFRISSITYTKNSGKNVFTSYYRVMFSYSERDDKDLIYQ